MNDSNFIKEASCKKISTGINLFAKFYELTALKVQFTAVGKFLFIILLLNERKFFALGVILEFTAICEKFYRYFKFYCDFVNTSFGFFRRNFSIFVCFCLS